MVAAAHRLEAREAAQHRRLAAARGPEQAADAARGAARTTAAHDAMRAVRVLELDDFDRGGHPRESTRAVATRLRDVLLRAAAAALRSSRASPPCAGPMQHLRIRRRRHALGALAPPTPACAASNAPASASDFASPSWKNASPKNVAVAADAAAERRAVRLRGGDHERVVVRERVDEAAGVARGDDDDPPADAGVVERACAAAAA